MRVRYRNVKLQPPHLVDLFYTLLQRNIIFTEISRANFNVFSIYLFIYYYYYFINLFITLLYLYIISYLYIILFIYYLNIYIIYSIFICVVTYSLTSQSLAVSLLTTRFNIQNSTWCSLCVECFVRISEQTAAFALYVIN